MATLTLRNFDDDMLNHLKQATDEKMCSSALRMAAAAYPKHVEIIRSQQARIEELEKELGLVNHKIAGFVDGLRFMTDNFNQEEKYEKRRPNY